MNLTNKEIFDSYSETQLEIKPTSKYDKHLFDLRLSLIRKYGTDKDVVDLCCGMGSYLIPNLRLFKSIVAIDISSKLLSVLKNKVAVYPHSHLTILENNAEQIELPAESVDFVFSYTSLYLVENIDKVLREVARILRPGGHAVLEIGNRYSLNKIVCDTMSKTSGWAKIFTPPLWKSMALVRETGFRVVDSHSFQILPMCGSGRSLLPVYPLISPKWKTIFGVTLFNRMIDDWISSSWPLRFFAFRHILELEK